MTALALLRRPAAVLMALALAAGCASEPTSPEPDALAGIRITANTAGTPIATLVVEVSAADMPGTLVFNLVVDEVTGVASGTVKVPHGPARTFHITAFDDTGEITHEGQATIDVQPGQNPPLQITLGPRSGHVPLTVSFGSFSVIVTPSSAVLSVAGETVQLTAQVIDEEGDFLPEGTPVQWATTNPALVTVDANGLVTAAGLAGTAFSGEALIVATYEGVAGFSSINPGGGSTEDADADGYTAAAGDCNDENSSVYPGAPEVLDGMDNNCDGSVDEGFQVVITEIQAIPYAGTADWGEWIEVWNASGQELDPNGLMLIVNNQLCSVTSALPVPPAGYFTINFGVYSAAPNKYGCVNGMGGPVLSTLTDGPINIQLGYGGVTADVAFMDVLLDQVILPDDAVAGTPRSLSPAATDPLANDNPSNWCLAAAGGTPGQANFDCF